MPNIVSLLSIRGSSTGDITSIKNMASNPVSREAFIDFTIGEARLYGYHGLDIDFNGYANASEMANMGTLLDEWRAAINAESLASGQKRLILTAAVSPLPKMRGEGRGSLPTEAIARSLDWVNVAAYDFYNSSSFLTRAPASLFDPGNLISGSMGIDAWIAAGVPPEKLVLGLPFYGYSWKLMNVNAHGILAPTDGPGPSMFPQTGWVSYRDVKLQFIWKGATVKYDANYVTNYCYLGTTWVGYDDTQSISAKVQYAKKRGLRGYFAWNVGLDHNWALSNEAWNTWEGAPSSSE